MLSEHYASRYIGQPGAGEKSWFLEGELILQEKSYHPLNSSLQATCSQVRHSTVGLSVIHNCLKTPVVRCCLCTHSDVLGLMVSAALPNTPAAWLPPTAERGKKGYVANPQLLQFTVPA